MNAWRLDGMARHMAERIAPRRRLVGLAGAVTMLLLEAPRAADVADAKGKGGKKKCRRCGICQQCKKGKCRPRPDGTECGACQACRAGACANALDGTPCEGDHECWSGACACGVDKTACGGRCVDTQTAASDCGICGRPCKNDEGCVFGLCAKAWGRGGAGPGEFHNPFAIAVAQDGRVYVTDTGNARVQRFSADGDFQITWGSQGTEPGQFLAAFGIAVAPSGDVYVVDQNAPSWTFIVQQFTADGDFIRGWGIDGFGDGEFRSPRDIAVDAAGRVYVADTGNSRVQRFSADGEFIDAFGQEHILHAWSIAVGPDGDVYVGSYGHNRIHRFNGDGEFLHEWDYQIPWGLAVDDKGRVYVADGLHAQVCRFSAGGDLHFCWGEDGFTGDLGQFVFPGRVAIGPDGHVYVTDTGTESVQRFELA